MKEGRQKTQTKKRERERKNERKKNEEKKSRSSVFLSYSIFNDRVVSSCLKNWVTALVMFTIMALTIATHFHHSFQKFHSAIIAIR